MDNKKIGKLIANLRKKQELTQQELGDKVGVGFRAVSKWERGITLPDISIINELSKILGISSDELLSGELKKENKAKDKKKLPTSIKITISITTIVLLIITSALIYYNNKVYVYEIKKLDGEDYYVEGQVTFHRKEVSIIVNNLKFEDKEFSSTVIKNYEYDIKSGDKHIFGYGLDPNGRNVVENLTIEKITKNFSVNYIGQTSISRQEIIKNNISIIFNFIDENNNEMIKEVEFSLYQIDKETDKKN